MQSALLSPDVIRWKQGDHELLWQAKTGRSVALHADTLAQLHTPALAPVRARLARLHLLAASPLPDRRELVPVRSRMVLLLPARPALWAPVPDAHTAGGHAYRALPLSPVEQRIWSAIDDRRTTEQLAEAVSASLSEVEALCDRLCAPDVQALQLRDEPLRRLDPTLSRVVGRPRPDNARSVDQHGPQGETDLRTYHQHDITDGATHFDDRETTVAHAHAVPHAMLHGRTYGEQLFAVLAARGLVPERGLIAEVGCGTGEMAAAFWRSAAKPELSYLRIDLSPELLKTQARNAPDTQGQLGDATALPLADGSVQLLLSNEVIADLCAATADTPAVPEYLARYALPPQPPGSPYNLGAWQLIEELARVLAPGGAAFVSEFGSPDDPPEEATQLDHPEVSIHFGHLVRIATALGLAAELVPLAELLQADLSAPHLARASYMGLRALCRSQAVHLAARAWTAASVADALPEPVESLHDARCDDPGPGPLITRFWALLLRKPAA